MLGDASPRWSPGEHWVVAWPGGVGLVDACVPLAAIERMWSRMHRESELGTFLEVLAENSAGGFLGLPEFAVVVTNGPQSHIAVRGEARVEIVVGGRSEVITGRGITTWAEKLLVDPTSLRLVLAESEAVSAPLVDGIASAGAVTVGELVPTTASATPMAPAPAPPMAAAPKPTWAAAPEPTVEPVVGSPAQVVETMIDEPVGSAEGEQDDEGDGDSAAESESMAPSREGTAQRVVNNPYRSLWESSIAIDVEAAAIRSDEGDPSVVDGSTPTADKPAVARSGLPDEQQDELRLNDQLTGDTVADLGVIAVQMTSRGPEVLARFCDRGHANPPERADCFSCGAPVVGEAKRTERPQLGWLRVEGGEAVPLRGPVIAGRNPSSSVLPLGESPRLLALPYAHVSSTHLAVLTEGWRLLIRDLGSKNGTFLRRHGKPPVRLPASSVPLVPGDLIDLGHGVFLHLERTP